MEKATLEPIPLNHLHVVCVGAFGKTVAKCLASLHLSVRETHSDGSVSIDLDEWPTVGVEVIAASKPVPDLCNFIDRYSREHGRPVIPLVLDSSVLRLGPIIVPGIGGCWRCWQMRSLQHAKLLPERIALLQFYEANRLVEPQGFLEPFAMIGAVQIASAIQSRDHLNQIAGNIWQIDLFTREVTTGYLVGVDGCPYCGLDRPLDSRSYAEMQTKLAYLWKDPARVDLSEVERTIDP